MKTLTAPITKTNKKPEIKIQQSRSTEPICNLNTGESVTDISEAAQEWMAKNSYKLENSY